MSTLTLENRVALLALARNVQTLPNRLGTTIDRLVSARAARQILEWQMRQVQDEIDRRLSKGPRR
jgi:hypothetical protein